MLITLAILGIFKKFYSGNKQAVTVIIILKKKFFWSKKVLKTA